MRKFGHFIRSMSDWYAKAGAVLILGVIVVSCFDVLSSNLFNWPVLGVIEIISLFLGVVIALAIARAQVSKRHIMIEVFTSWLPVRSQRAIDCIVSLIMLAFFAVLTWQFILLGISDRAVGEYSITLHLPFHYFVFVMAFGFIGACLVFLLEFINNLKGARSK